MPDLAKFGFAKINYLDSQKIINYFIWIRQAKNSKLANEAPDRAQTWWVLADIAEENSRLVGARLANQALQNFEIFWNLSCRDLSCCIPCSQTQIKHLPLCTRSRPIRDLRSSRNHCGRQCKMFTWCFRSLQTDDDQSMSHSAIDSTKRHWKLGLVLVIH